MRSHHDPKIDMIQRLPLFRDCTAEEISAISGIADEIDLSADKRLIREGADGHEFVVIVEGAAEVLKGEEQVATIGSGSYIGEVSLLTGGPRNASVVATSPVRVLATEGRRFRTLLEQSPGIRTKVEDAASRRRR